MKTARKAYAIHLPALVWALLSVIPLGLCAAETDGEGMRYTFVKLDGVLHRCDGKTGNLEQLMRTPEGLKWVRADVASDTKFGNTGSSPVVAQSISPTDAASVAQSRTNENSRPATMPQRPHIPDSALTDIVTPEERAKSAADIVAYESNLGILQTLQTGDRITGTLIVRNRGKMRIRKMEISLIMTVEGRADPETHRFVFLDKEGSERPPQPEINGDGGKPLMHKFDLPAPSGAVKGPADFKITCLVLENL